MKSENFLNYILCVVDLLKNQINGSIKNKNHSFSLEDDAYKMGYLMALQDVIDIMKLRTSDFDIEKKSIGLMDSDKEKLERFLLNLSYISEKKYQKRIKFSEEKNYEGEFSKLNECITDQCEELLMLQEFSKSQRESLLLFYNHLDSFYQNYDTFYVFQRRLKWRKIVGLSKEVLKAFNYEKPSGIQKQYN